METLTTLLSGILPYHLGFVAGGIGLGATIYWLGVRMCKSKDGEEGFFDGIVPLIVLGLIAMFFGHDMYVFFGYGYGVEAPLFPAIGLGALNGLIIIVAWGLWCNRHQDEEYAAGAIILTILLIVILAMTVYTVRTDLKYNDYWLATVKEPAILAEYEILAAKEEADNDAKVSHLAAAAKYNPDYRIQLIGYLVNSNQIAEAETELKKGGFASREHQAQADIYAAFIQLRYAHVGEALEKLEQTWFPIHQFSGWSLVAYLWYTAQGDYQHAERFFGGLDQQPTPCEDDLDIACRAIFLNYLLALEKDPETAETLLSAGFFRKIELQKRKAAALQAANLIVETYKPSDTDLEEQVAVIIGKTLSAQNSQFSTDAVSELLNLAAAKVKAPPATIAPLSSTFRVAPERKDGPGIAFLALMIVGLIFGKIIITALGDLWCSLNKLELQLRALLNRAGKAWDDWRYDPVAQAERNYKQLQALVPDEFIATPQNPPLDALLNQLCGMNAQVREVMDYLVILEQELGFLGKLKMTRGISPEMDTQIDEAEAILRELQERKRAGKELLRTIPTTMLAMAPAILHYVVCVRTSQHVNAVEEAGNRLKKMGDLNQTLSQALAQFLEIERLAKDAARAAHPS